MFTDAYSIILSLIKAFFVTFNETGNVMRLILKLCMKYDGCFIMSLIFWYMLANYFEILICVIMQNN